MKKSYTPLLILPLLLLAWQWMKAPYSALSATHPRSTQALRGNPATSAQPSSSKSNRVPPTAPLPSVDPQRVKTLSVFLRTEGLKMDQLQTNPAKIEAALQNVAQNLSLAEAHFLALQASNLGRTHNERALAVDLLTRQPRKFTSALLIILARENNLQQFQKMEHIQRDIMVNFEVSLSLQVLQSLEALAVSEAKVMASLEDIASSNIARPTKSHVLVSLQAARVGQKYWTNKSAALLNGASL